MSTAISMFMNYSASEVLLMEKEKYFRTELDVIHFHTEDVITTSDIVEEDNHEHGGGSMVDP